MTEPRPPTVAELLRDGARCDRAGRLWRMFLQFHNANPWVYERFKESALSLRGNGWRRYGAQTIFEVIRYEWDLRTGGEHVVTSDGSMLQVKLNNNHVAYYARILIEEHPSLWDFFQLRQAEGDPTELPRPGQQSLFMGRQRVCL